MTLYFFYSPISALAGRLWNAPVAPPPRETDPIDHPAIAAMTLRELADLPLRPDPRSIKAEPATAPFPPRRRTEALC